jgi:hypothetical protein
MVTVLAAPGLAQAATVKLNKTSLTLNEGNSYRLQVTGTTKTVKWSSSDKKIATVSSRGTVKAISAGTATITATISTKKYTCKVTVKDVLTNEEAASNITYDIVELQDRLLLILQNKNKVNLELEVEVTYYDDNKAVLSTEKGFLWTFESGRNAVISLSYPLDDKYNRVAFNEFNIKVTADLEYTSQDKVIDVISVESNKGSKNLIATLTNNSDEDISSMDLVALFYKNEVIVGYSMDFIYDIAAGESKSAEFYEPYDENYDKIEYDDYEIIINEASFE